MQPTVKAQVPYVLGIDLGANSVGWAALRIGSDGEPDGLLTRPLDPTPTLGVRVFEIGVENYGFGEKEQPRNTKRRVMRLQRRQTERRARRMRKTFHLLQEIGLLPSFEPQAIVEAGSREAARDSLLKTLDRKLSESLALKVGTDAQQQDLAWKRLPYLLRARALDFALEPYEIGRAIYHLAQRRGFLSNRKIAEKKVDDQSKVKKGIAEILQRMTSAAPGSETPFARTLGEFLSKLDPSSERLRQRWTSRQMYLDEFEAIWTHQQTFRPDLLTPEHKRRLWGAIFRQRPLRSQKDLIGYCEFESGDEYASIATGEILKTKRRRRAPACLMLSQRVHLLQRVNDLRLKPLHGELARRLTNEERRKLLADLEVKPKITYKAARKLLGLPKEAQFTIEDGGEKEIRGSKTFACLLEALGPRFAALTESKQEAIVEAMWSASDDATLRKHIEKGLGIWGEIRPTATETKALLEDVTLDQEYAALSRAAMRRLRPLMEEGLSLVEAADRAYGRRVSRETRDALPPARQFLPNVTNPVVLRSLSELRRVVNAVLRAFGKPERIRIELARDLKKSKDERYEAIRTSRDRETERKAAAEQIVKETGRAAPSGEEILRVRLANELDWTCPYSGRSFGMSDLLESGQMDVDHIIPFSRCLDDSFGNKTVCFSDVNRHEKRNRTPSEAFGSNEERWELIETRLRLLEDRGLMSGSKVRRFLMRGEEMEKRLAQFASSQLNDTRYASVCARQYLTSIYGGDLKRGVDADGVLRVQVGNGEVTSLLRRALGMNGLLGGGERKTRDDHRHHAVDAVAVALSSPSIQKKLADSADHAWAQRHRLLEGLSSPWPSFVEDVRAALGRTIVSHRINARVRGALHEETLYSPPFTSLARRASAEVPGSERFVHKRVGLERLTLADIEKIVDPTVRELVREKLAGAADPKKVFIPEDPTTLPALPNRNGTSIPIRRVRIRVKENARQISAGARVRHVLSDENHHVALYLSKDEKGREKWIAQVVNMLEAARRVAAHEPVIRRFGPNGESLVFALRKNNVVEINSLDGKNREYRRITGFTTRSSGQTEISLFRIEDSREISKIGDVGNTAKSDVLRKRAALRYSVSPLGIVRRARD